MTKALTISEMGKKGAETTNSKYSKEVRSEWAKKGPEALKAKYGREHYVKMVNARWSKEKAKKANPTLKELFGLKEST